MANGKGLSRVDDDFGHHVAIVVEALMLFPMFVIGVVSECPLHRAGLPGVRFVERAPIPDFNTGRTTD